MTSARRLSFIEAHRNELPELERSWRTPPVSAQRIHGAFDRVTWRRHGGHAHHPQFELYNPGDVVGISGAERQLQQHADGTERITARPRKQPRREVGQLDTKDAVAASS